MLDLTVRLRLKREEEGAEAVERKEYPSRVYLHSFRYDFLIPRDILIHWIGSGSCLAIYL